MGQNPYHDEELLHRDELPTLAEALMLLKPAAPLGAHPADQQPVTLSVGKFGPYIRHGKLNAPVPRVRLFVVVVTAQGVACGRRVESCRLIPHALHQDGHGKGLKADTGTQCMPGLRRPCGTHRCSMQRVLFCVTKYSVSFKIDPDACRASIPRT